MGKKKKGVKQKESFGGANVDHLIPSRSEEWPKAINMVLSFEEGLKLHLGLGQGLQKLNTYDRKTKEGQKTAVNLCLFTEQGRMTVSEAKLRGKS